MSPGVDLELPNPGGRCIVIGIHRPIKVFSLPLLLPSSDVFPADLDLDCRSKDRDGSTALDRAKAGMAECGGRSEQHREVINYLSRFK